MNRNDGFGSRAKRLFEPGRVHRVITFIYIDKHRPSSTVGDCFSSGHERVGYSYHFIARPDAACQKREPKCFSPAAHADCVLAAAIRRKVLFEFFNKRPASEGARVNYGTNGAVKLIVESGVMRFKIEKWYSNVHFFLEDFRESVQEFPSPLCLRLCLRTGRHRERYISNDELINTSPRLIR